MYTKRGQGISVNVIIVAAIALVVFVILVALVFRTGGDITKGTSSCEALGDPGEEYKCVFQSEYDARGCGQGWSRNVLRGCISSTVENPQVCCTPNFS